MLVIKKNEAAPNASGYQTGPYVVGRENEAAPGAAGCITGSGERGQAHVGVQKVKLCPMQLVVKQAHVLAGRKLKLRPM